MVFKPGESGNKKGTRDGDKRASRVFRGKLEELHSDVIPPDHKLTRLEVLFFRLYKKALESEVKPIQELLNRAYGKPKEQMDIESGGSVTFIVNPSIIKEEKPLENKEETKPDNDSTAD